MISGRLWSFNFQPGNVRASLQLSNQDYRICVRPEENFCGIQYSACPDQQDLMNANNNQGDVASKTKSGYDQEAAIT